MELRLWEEISLVAVTAGIHTCRHRRLHYPASLDWSRNAGSLRMCGGQMIVLFAAPLSLPSPIF